MAQTWDKFRDAARLAQAVADQLDVVRDLGRLLRDTHNGNDFSGAATGPPAWVLTGTDGNIKGQTFTPSEYLSAVTMVNELEDFFTNQAVAQGDYKSTVAKVRSPRPGG